MTSMFRVVTLVKERRTYLVKATSLAAAEESVLEHYLCPDKTETIDEFIRDSSEVSKEEMVDS